MKTTKQYQVVKDWLGFKPGTILTSRKNKAIYELTNIDKGEHYTTTAIVCLNGTDLRELIENNTLSPVGASFKLNKLSQIKMFINILKTKYDERKQAIEKQYEDKKIPTCVKVEHDTVYFNLMKVLNKIESIINE